MPKRSVLYWGPAKSGKTHQALTWPDPFVCYFDNNLATLLKFDVPYVALNSFAEFESEVMPAIRTKKIKAKTIVIDSYSFAAQYLRQETQGSSDKMPIHAWGTVMDKLWRVTKELTELASQEDGYNIIATVHERDVTDGDGGLIRFDPAIQGQFKDWLPRFFDTVLVMQKEQKKEAVNGKIMETVSYVAHTVPPTSHWICGDGVGGGIGDKSEDVAPGVPKALPGKLSGTYTSLMEAWGLHGEDD